MKLLEYLCQVGWWASVEVVPLLRIGVDLHSRLSEEMGPLGGGVWGEPFHSYMGL